MTDTFPPSPIQLVDQIVNIDCKPDCTVVTFGSGGATIRVQLSRSLFLHFVEKGRRKADAQQHMERVSAQIIAFPQPRRA